MKNLLGYMVCVGAAGLLYEWPASHDFLVSRGLQSTLINFGVPLALLLFGWVHIRAGMSSVTLAALRNYAVLLAMWAALYAINHHVSSLHKFLHTAWIVPFTVVYFAALIVAVPVAQWRRNHVPSGGSLQRYQPQGQSALQRSQPQRQQIQPHGAPAPSLIRGVTYPAHPVRKPGEAYPVRNSFVDQFVELSQAELLHIANNHRGAMHVYYEHVRDEDGNEFMVSRKEWEQ